MTPADLRAALDAIGWGPTTLAERAGINERTVRRWLAGQNPVPGAVAAWLAALAAAHERLGVSERR